LRNFVIPKPLNFLTPTTFFIFSSHLINCLFLGSCSLFSLMYDHIFLTTSARVAVSVPTISASSSERFIVLVNPPPLPRFFLGFGSPSESSSVSDFLRRCGVGFSSVSLAVRSLSRRGSHRRRKSLSSCASWASPSSFSGRPTPHPRTTLSPPQTLLSLPRSRSLTASASSASLASVPS